MADHVYKPSEVPKGQRWQHFLDYYKIPFIVTIVGVLALASILKTAVFDPKPDATILAASGVYTDYALWDAAAEGFAAMAVDVNGDEKSLIEINYINVDESMEKSDPEAYMAYQTKLMASLASAESALQVVDDAMFAYFEEEQLVGTYAELPDSMGHSADEVIKIPLKELAPFSQLADFPDGYYMTLRPKAAMQIGSSEKKLRRWEQQVEILMTMME